MQGVNQESFLGLESEHVSFYFCQLVINQGKHKEKDKSN